jgi:hypothetical protein
VAVWVTVLVSIGVEIGNNWRPVGDNAAIASRAYQTFSAHPPLVGMLSTAGRTGHTLYDPGPLLFWLLAVPVHLDTTQGVLWGAAVLSGAVLSVAIEAVWTTRLWAGCGVIAFAVADMFWLTPSVFENISWNAYFPIPFFIATLALTWVVGCGRFGWWPVLVLTASVAAQAHLLFSIPCAALAVCAPLAGLALGSRPRRLRWLWVGLVVAIACWIAPILQQIFGVSGNLGALAGGESGQSRLGVSFALSLMGRVALPGPAWLAHQPTTAAGLFSFESAAKAASGVVVAAVLIATLAWAWVTKRSSLAAAAIACFLANITLLVSFAVFPTKNALNLFYLIDVVWPLGVMIWATILWALMTVVVDVAHRQSGSRHPITNDTVGDHARKRWQAAGALAGVVVVALVCLQGVREASRFTPHEDTVSWNQSDAHAIANVSRAVEQAVTAGPVVVSIMNAPGSVISAIWINEGVAWQLEADGWAPGLSTFEADYTGLKLPSGTEYTQVAVTMDETKVASVTTAHCRVGVARCTPLTPGSE